MDDAKGGPVTSDPGEGSDENVEKGPEKPPKDEQDEPRSARTATAEFRIPVDPSLTRPDISIRRPTKPDDETTEEPAPTPPQGPWYVQLPKPAEKEEPAPEPEEAAATQAPDEETEDAPDETQSGGAGPTRVEPLPVLYTQPPQEELTTPDPAPAPTQALAPAPAPAQFPVLAQAPPTFAAPPAPAPAPEATQTNGSRYGLVVIVAALLLIVGVVAGQLVRPVPDPSVKLALASSHTFPGQAPALLTPPVGQAAVQAEGLGTMGASGGATPIPTASVAKVMTAFVYLRDHPLRAGEQGPELTVSPQAAAQIPARKRRGESLLEVTANQRLTQHRALQALLIISANDVAHELARWDSGNEQAFVAKMNETARSLGMTSTHYTDPSGYDSRTVSTAADQVKLLRAAMSVPVFAQIVNTRVFVPDDGRPPMQSGNFLLGRYGVVGGKTGYTDAAGGNFVFAAYANTAGVRTLLVGAVMGQRSPTAAGAVAAAERLVVSAERALVPAQLAPRGAKVAQVDDGLGGKTPLRAAAPVTAVGWGGLTVPVRVTGDPPHTANAGQRIATMQAGGASIPLELGESLEKPSIFSRLLRIN